MRQIEFQELTIEEAVNELLAAKARGEQICGIFNGHKLYSDTVTLDSAYKEITGSTKEEYDKKIREWREKSRKKRRGS